MVIRIIRINSEYHISEIKEQKIIKTYKHFIADCYDFDISRDIIASIMKDVGNPQIFGILLEIRNEEYNKETRTINTGEKMTSVFINISKIKSRRCTNEKIVTELVLHEFDRIRTTFNYVEEGKENILAKATISFKSFNDLYNSLKWMDLDIEKVFQCVKSPDVIFESKEHQKIYRNIALSSYPYTFGDYKDLFEEDDDKDLLDLKGELEMEEQPKIPLEENDDPRSRGFEDEYDIRRNMENVGEPVDSNER